MRQREAKKNVWVLMAKKAVGAREMMCVFMPSWLIRVQLLLIMVP